MTRAQYHVEQHDGVIVVIDLNGNVSVTNDAEAVIEDLGRTHDLTKNRVVYRDSEHRYDGLAVQGGQFAGYVALGCTGKEHAINLAQIRPVWASNVRVTDSHD